MGIEGANAKSCWEFWACPDETKNKCPVYTAGAGRDCWRFTAKFCPVLKSGIRDCFACPWYKKVKSESKEIP
jgi:hypothetical protein